VASLTTVRLAVSSSSDGARARREARAQAGTLGFSRVETERLALAVSELAANLARYAMIGEIVIVSLDGGFRRGVQIESRDCGPGIADLARALEDGFSTGGGLGSGLPAVRRLMDEFEIESGPEGTRITARLWSNSP
jgi:serine/threonine-protein kinase RsbT